MSRSLLLVSCLVIGLLVLACSKQDTNRSETNRNAAATTAPAAASPVATVAAAETIGVPECDTFIKEYETCVTTKVPAQARAQWETALKTWRTEWKKLAANPQTKAQLVTVCKTQLENARTQMKAYNCTF